METSVKEEKAKPEASLKCSSSSKSSVKAASRADSKYLFPSKSPITDAATRARASTEAVLNQGILYKKNKKLKNSWKLKTEKARLHLEKATLEADLEAWEIEKEAAAA